MRRQVLNREAVEGSTNFWIRPWFRFENGIIFPASPRLTPNPAELNGRMVIAVANFAPRKMAKIQAHPKAYPPAATAEGNQLDAVDGAQPGDKVGWDQILRRNHVKPFRTDTWKKLSCFMMQAYRLAPLLAGCVWNFR